MERLAVDGVGREHYAKLDPLPLPMGELADDAGRDRRQADAFEHLVDDGPRRGAPRCMRPPQARDSPARVRPSKTLGTCVLMPTPSRAISCGSAREMSWPRNQHRARGRLKLAGQHLEERALAGPVRADQAAQLPLGEDGSSPPAPPARRRSACRGRESRAAARSSRRAFARGARQGCAELADATARGLSARAARRRPGRRPERAGRCRGALSTPWRRSARSRQAPRSAIECRCSRRSARSACPGRRRSPR